jgi:hypothetical protein
MARYPLLNDRWINLRADRCLTASGAEIAPYYVLIYPDWVNVVAVTLTIAWYWFAIPPRRRRVHFRGAWRHR